MLLIKLGPLTGQEKALFWGIGVEPDGQMPTICFPLQIRLDEIKAAAGEPWGIRRILEVVIIFDSNHQGHSNFFQNSGKIKLMET